ncbi:myosin light polypeptide 6-like isoform X2 [Convolutriloba macropyga]|uniref:myosin light polypeptide 6-like isoform X2 n=1 Tax=Convolutriloba macropyga TaxID=536237 RepID=UPI003F526F20
MQKQKDSSSIRNMDKLSEEKLNELRDAFALFDKEGKGTLKASDIGDLARAMGTDCTVKDANRITGAKDDPNKALKFEEFVPMMLDLQKIENPLKKADFMEGFKCVMDNANTGLVEFEMIKQVLMKLGEKCDEEAVMMVLKGMADDQGMIKYEDVITKVLEGNY